MTEQPVLITSVIAEEDLSKHIFVNTNGQTCDAATIPLGVVNADTKLNEQCPVATSGIVLVYSGASLSSGNPIQSDDNGKVIQQTDDYFKRGFAIDSASGADELIRVLLF